MKINFFNKYMSLHKKEVSKTYELKLLASYSYLLPYYSMDSTVIHIVIRTSACSGRNNLFQL